MIDTHTDKSRREIGNKALLSTRLYPLVEIAMRNYDVKRYDLIHPAAILHIKLNPTGVASDCRRTMFDLSSNYRLSEHR